MNRTLLQISNAGFQVINGPNAWYFPEGTKQPADVPRIHIGGSVNHNPPASMNITFVSIGPHAAGQNLRWDKEKGKWDLDTPGIDWGGYKGEMSNVLTTLGIAS